MSYMNPTPITLATLIAHLQTLPQDALVAFSLHSEHKILELDEISVERFQPPRPDGWIAGRWGHDSDPLRTQTYVLFPGN